MILRLAAVTAVHGAAGVALGLTGVLAACTVARTAEVASRRLRRERMAVPPFPDFTRPAPAPAAPVPPDTAGTP